MDFLTHALLPGLLAGSLELQKRRLAALVLGGIAPDLDIFITWMRGLIPADILLVHRGITHSLFFGPIFGLLLLWIVTHPVVRGRLEKLIGWGPDLSKDSMALVFGGVLIHLLLDYTTTRGLPLLYPFEALRYSADIFFQIEPVLLAASLLILASMMLDRTLVQKNRSLCVAFVVLLLLTGCIRIEGREAAEESLIGKGASVYPEAGLFSWALLEEQSDRYLVYEYDYLRGRLSNATTFPRLSVASSRAQAEEAIATASEMDGVRLFFWRAHAVAINASQFENGSWMIRFYDPVTSAQSENSSSLFRLPSKRYGEITVLVTGDGATEIEK